MKLQGCFLFILAQNIWIFISLACPRSSTEWVIFTDLKSKSIDMRICWSVFAISITISFLLGHLPPAYLIKGKLSRCFSHAYTTDKEMHTTTLHQSYFNETRSEQCLDTNELLVKPALSWVFVCVCVIVINVLKFVVVKRFSQSGMSLH